LEAFGTIGARLGTFGKVVLFPGAWFHWAPDCLQGKIKYGSSSIGFLVAAKC
jgi:hypothetical protein